MAYAEKRGKGPAPWRVKYRLPSGIETSESGFETKAAALTWGRDQEARIREGRWTDPNAGKLTVGEWIERWLAIQDVGISTVDHRDYLLRRFIRPTWDETPLHSLSTEEITQWENGLPARTGVSPRTARAARTLLGTILGDAATTRPPLIPYNPALRPRNRGRRTGRRLQFSPQRAWATPLETLLLAERAALMTGRDEDFTMIVTIGYTGLRWGEAIGLERGCLHPGEIHVEWQLRELNGQFHRLPPKDDSYRSPAWEPCLPVNLPPFLTGLLTRHKMISRNPPNRPRRPARATLAMRGEPELTASDLARYQESGSGAKGTRTPDPLVANQVLFQLSYSPARRRYKGTRSAHPVRGAAPAAPPQVACPPALVLPAHEPAAPHHPERPDPERPDPQHPDPQHPPRDPKPGR